MRYNEHTNVRLISKITDVILSSNSRDIVIPAKTWVNPEHDDNIFLIDGYNLVRKADRKGRPGARMWIMIKKNLNYTLFTAL